MHPFRIIRHYQSYEVPGQYNDKQCNMIIGAGQRGIYIFVENYNIGCVLGTVLGLKIFLSKQTLLQRK